MDDEYTPEIIAITDDDGTEYTFEIIDKIEDDDGKYIAAVPTDGVFDEEEEETEVWILQVDDTGDDETSSIFQIEDKKKFEEISRIFEERIFGDNEE